jgi:uncharacterized RDD family membrane protein YckC
VSTKFKRKHELAMKEKKTPSATLQNKSSLPARPLRRMMAMVYELLPMTAILLLAAAPIAPLMPEDHVSAGSLWFQMYLFFIVYLYFAWCWSHGGQTLGMRTWKLFVESQDQEGVNWRGASLRFVVSILGWLPLGIGHWWVLIDSQGRSWHDIASNTRVVFRQSGAAPQDH